MRLLMLAPYPPYPPHGGGRERMYQLLRGLARRHEITCLTFAPDLYTVEALAPLHQICRVETVLGPPQRSALRRAVTTLTARQPDMALRNASPGYRAALRHLLAHEPFDAVLAESIEMARYLDEVPATRPERALRVLDQFNAEYVVQRRAALADLRRLRRLPAGIYSLIQWLKLARYERHVLQRCDLALAVSHDDQRWLARLAPAAQYVVVPNGVDTTYFTPLAAATREPATLVFTGTLDYRPNVDAVRWFVAEVWPRIHVRCPETRLVLVGRRPAPVIQALAAQHAPAIDLVGEVPDARPYFARAAVYVVPMRIGGGVRLKLLEALAMEAPTVSTPMGVEGVSGLHAGEHCLVADTAEAFAAATLQLLADPQRGAQLGASGRALVAAHYDWQGIVPRLEAALSRLTDAAR